MSIKIIKLHVIIEHRLTGRSDKNYGSWAKIVIIFKYVSVPFIENSRTLSPFRWKLSCFGPRTGTNFRYVKLRCILHWFQGEQSIIFNDIPNSALEGNRNATNFAQCWNYFSPFGSFRWRLFHIPPIEDFINLSLEVTNSNAIWARF